MRHLLLLAALFLVLAIGNATPAHAGRPVPQSRYGEWIRVNHNGTITYRYVYRGYRAGFPPPALYYYGYPRSGYTYGTGIDQTY